ncbi:hypothetical protein ACB087_02005 [Vibrio sp. VNB-15]
MNSIKCYGLSQMKVSTLIYRQMPTDLSIYEKMLMLAFANRFRDGKTISVGLDELVTECSMSKRSVGTYIKSLEKRGFISKHRVGLGANNEYTIDLDAMGVDCSNYKQRDNVVQLQVVNG